MKPQPEPTNNPTPRITILTETAYNSTAQGRWHKITIIKNTREHSICFGDDGTLKNVAERLRGLAKMLAEAEDDKL